MKMIRHSLFNIPLFVCYILSNISCTPVPIRVDYISNITVTDLGTLPGGRNSWANDINDEGIIVGDSDTSSSGDRRAFVIEDSGMQNLGTFPGGGASYAKGISNDGFIVGAAFNNVNVEHGFVYRYHTMFDLGANPRADRLGSFSIAFAVNDNSLVAGIIDGAGIVWDLDTRPIFPPLPPAFRVTDPGSSTYTHVHDINNSGQVAGEFLSLGRAFRGPPGTLQELRSLGSAIDDRAYGINNRGQVVGMSILVPPFHHAVTWSNPSTIRDLGTLGGPNSVAEDINDNGIVVGSSETTTGV